MSLATWWHIDPLPNLWPIKDIRFEQATNSALLERLNHISLEEVHRRWDAGNRAYVAWVDTEPVAYGWIASRTISIGELSITASLPHQERYLWDFATVPHWRGRGIYPHLLQQILRSESRHAARFWIAYAPENTPSARGIQRAGLVRVGTLSFTPDGTVALQPNALIQRAEYGASVFGISLARTALAACWRCRPSRLALDAASPGCCFS